MIRRILALTFSVILALIISVPVSAHPGDTDAAGGHIDNFTGEYHYHHGYSAHQHTGGVCPYNFDDKTGWNSGSSTSSSFNSSSSLHSAYKAALSEAKENRSTDSENNLNDRYEAALTKSQETKAAASDRQKAILWRNIALIVLGAAVVWMGFSLRSANKERERLQSRCRSLQNDKTDLRQELYAANVAIFDHIKEKRQLQADHDALTQICEQATERAELAEAKAEACMCFIERFGANAEAFFSRPDADAKLSRMTADYLTLVYDASAEYLDRKEHPAHAEAKRIRELKAETKEWIDRALRAEYELEKLSSHDK